jgi:uncharacterized membrane protein
MNENANIRIEFFSDAVFAIAITLLILEIKVPLLHSAEVSRNLGTALLDLYPSYFGYVFSFLMIGIYWANHHRIFKLYRRGDDILVLLNIFFLMCVAFLPFPTAVLAEYLMHPEQRQTAVTFYTFGLFLPAFAWLLMWLYASLGHRLVDEKLDQSIYQTPDGEICSDQRSVFIGDSFVFVERRGSPGALRRIDASLSDSVEKAGIR